MIPLRHLLPIAVGASMVVLLSAPFARRAVFECVAAQERSDWNNYVERSRRDRQKAARELALELALREAEEFDLDAPGALVNMQESRIHP